MLEHYRNSKAIENTYVIIMDFVHMERDLGYFRIWAPTNAL
jgi:hypothetical protein